MHSINFNELRNAFEFVSSGPSSQHSAYICMNTGTIYWKSTVIDLEEKVPDDLETSDRYIPVPHKNNLKLGQNLALSFVSEEIPHDYNFAASLFRKRGAYRRFKELLRSEGKLEKWHVFEANASGIALLDWCKDNNIDPI